MDRVDAGTDMAFKIGFTGYSGHLRLEPLPPIERFDPVKSLPDFVLPSAFPQETPESIKKYLEDKYLLPELDPEEFSVEKDGRQWDFDWFDRAKVHLEPTLPRTVIVPEYVLPFERPKDWEPKSVETSVLELMEGSHESGSLPRMPGPPKDFVRGSIGNRPFRPGGLDVSQSQRVIPEGARTGEWVREILYGGHAQIVPPGFKHGLDLGDLKAHPCSWKVYKDEAVVKSSSEDKMSKLSVQFDELFKKAWEDDIPGDSQHEDEAEESQFESLKSDGGSLKPETETEAEADAGIPITASNVELEKKTDLSRSVPDTESIVLDEILSTDTVAPSSVENVSNGQQQKEAWATSRGSEAIVDHFTELVPDMALEFPFELDTFQKEAIYFLEKGESVFVAAHTSAGKTVVAEYAFALASKHCTRAVYTAPIKTISNQKYRDFCGKFDVGLLTGDVSIRPEASCLIMTTEILRSMLYRGADIIRDIEWVIFDEVHYVNDVERGVVWEEVIIMLPRHVNIVLLSATVPNTVEFADWIGRTKQKEIRVTGTTKRPVPLEHCLFYSGELYTICENEIFQPQGLKIAKDVYNKKNSPTIRGGTGTSSGSSSLRGGTPVRQQREHSTRGAQQKQFGSQTAGSFPGSSGTNQNNWGMRRPEASIWMQLINKLSKKSLLPVIIFCFSKNRCDKSADNITAIDLTSSSEKSEIRVFCDKAFSRLKGSDRNLPQVVRVQSLLRRGIGVHHAGLLPIVKEVVEMLFCRGVIKVLFSTETFAMGVNAPARTVVFDTLRKFDGKEFRQLLPGEYTQMAGRAGRRGLDKIGTVVMMCRDEVPEERELKNVIVGSATKLESQFRLTYIMILHLLRVEELKVEDMLKRSFAEFHAQRKLPEKEKLLLSKLAQPKADIQCIKGEPAIEEYYGMLIESDGHRESVLEKVMQSSSAQNFLSPGRVVVVKSQSADDHLLGVVLKTPSATFKQHIVLVLRPDLSSTPKNADQSKGKGSTKEAPEGYFIAPKSKRGLDDDYFTTTSSRKGSGAVNIQLPYVSSASGMSFEVMGIDIKEVLSICVSKIKIDVVRLLEDCSNAAFSNAVQQLLGLKSKENKYPAALDPVSDLKLKDAALVEAYKKWTNILRTMSENKCHGCVKLKEHLLILQEMHKHQEEVKFLRYQMSDEALQQMPDFQGRIDVLKEIGCIDPDLVVQIKGRVACEMNSGEELISTECLFENQLEDLEPEEAVALMSALVFQQKNASDPCLTPKLAHAKQRLYDTAIRLGKLQEKFKLPISPEEYAADNLKFGLVEVVYEWAKGTPFADICELTDVPEGLIVRTIVRLDETCREFKNAAAIMGNSALQKKMETASNAIKRDIVFAASLYITGV